MSIQTLRSRIQELLATYEKDLSNEPFYIAIKRLIEADELKYRHFEQKAERNVKKIRDSE
jgi:hypothetical protein